jgi:hypothetical protein
MARRPAFERWPCSCGVVYERGRAQFRGRSDDGRNAIIGGRRIPARVLAICD